MSGRSSQSSPSWLQDTSGRRFYYHEATDTLVYESGQTFPRPQIVPRSLYLTGVQTPNTQQGPYQSSQQNQYYVYGNTQADNSQVQGQGSFNNDRHIDTRHDPSSQVQTMVATGAGINTDEALRRYGVQAFEELLANDNAREGEAEQLYPDYKVRRWDFFRVGRVFHVLWAEPAGSSSRSSMSWIEWARPSDPNLVPSRYAGNLISSKTRRFVVIRQGSNYCTVLPITTYGQRGVGKHGVTKSEHAIIYTGLTAPRPNTNEVPPRGSTERPMRESIRVIADVQTEALDPMSRLNLAQVCTVQHNYKVKPFGMVHESSMGILERQFNHVMGLPGSTSSNAPVAGSSSMANTPAMQPPRSGNIGGALPATEEQMVVHATHAQSAYNRLRGQNFSHEAAVQQLVTVLQQKENCNLQTARATISQRLSYRVPRGS